MKTRMPMVLTKKGAIRKAGKVKPRLTKPANTAVANVVRQVLGRVLETKYTSALQTPLQFNSVINAFSSEAYPLLPPVPQIATGSVSDTTRRIGNNISPTSLKTTLFVGLNAVNRTLSLRVDVFVLTRKDAKYWPDIKADTTTPLLYLAGNSPSAIGYSGFAHITASRYNLNQFSILKHKTFVLGGNAGQPNGDTTAGNSPNMSVAGMGRKLVLNLKCPKTLKYDESGDNTITFPNNYAPFMLIGYSKIDGSAPDISYQSIQASWCTAMTYKDA